MLITQGAKGNILIQSGDDSVELTPTEVAVLLESNTILDAAAAATIEDLKLRVEATADTEWWMVTDRSDPRGPVEIVFDGTFEQCRQYIQDHGRD